MRKIGWLFVEVKFYTPDLQNLCEDLKLMQRKFGPPLAKKLRARLDDLHAAANVIELPAGKPHRLKGNRKDQYGVTLMGGMRIVFEAANEPIPKVADGSVDWRYVTIIRVLEIGDYHE